MVSLLFTLLITPIFSNAANNDPIYLDALARNSHNLSLLIDATNFNFTDIVDIEVRGVVRDQEGNVLLRSYNYRERHTK